MGILYEYECQACGKCMEVMAALDGHPETIECLDCKGVAKKIISFSATNQAVFNDDAPWIRSVTDVVDKDPSKRHCQEFLARPTRENYRNWMKGEGLRPLERGERTRPEPVNEARMAEKVMRKHQERKSVQIG